MQASQKPAGPASDFSIVEAVTRLLQVRVTEVGYHPSHQPTIVRVLNSEASLTLSLAERSQRDPELPYNFIESCRPGVIYVLDRMTRNVTRT
jgi:hypothetical protein